MRVFAISDLHLPGPDGKKMDMFGAHWNDHFTKIRQDWLQRVSPEDLVLIPGDISWAMTLADARNDLDSVLSLPGYKVLLRGNHDYWWDSVSRVREALGDRAYALQNDVYIRDGLVICGSRGWTCPGRNDYSEHDEAIYRREAQRLRLSLDMAARKAPGIPPRVMMHFPPFNDKRQPSLFTQLFAEYGVRQVIYGHLHGSQQQRPFSGWHEGVHYEMVACDFLRFKLLEWPEQPQQA